MTLDDLRERFLNTSFCPGRLIRGREETPVVFTRLKTVSHGGNDYEYPSTSMYNVLTYMDGTEKHAEVPFAEWSTTADAEFVRDVIEWFRKDSGEEQ